MSYPQTQLEAWASIQENLPDARRAVLLTILNAGKHGISTIAISEKLGWPINCVSGRITELKRVGLVEDSGRRCENPSGRRGILWIKRDFKFDREGQGLVV